jgi:hypothetical protein
MKHVVFVYTIIYGLIICCSDKPKAVPIQYNMNINLCIVSRNKKFNYEITVKLRIA